MSAAQRSWCPAVTTRLCCSGVRGGSALQGLVQGQGQGAKHFTGGPGEESAFKLTQIVGRMNFSVAVEMRSACQGEPRSAAGEHHLLYHIPPPPPHWYLRVNDSRSDPSWALHLSNFSSCFQLEQTVCFQETPGG